MPSHKHRLAAFLGGLLLVASLPVTAQATPDPPFTLVFPQESHVTEFSSTFGARRSGGRRHQGTDLMAPKMTQVYAAAAGVVAAIDSSWRAGRYVIIEHQDGWSTMYVHLNDDTPGTDDGGADWSLAVAPGLAEGSHVTAGQLIGFVGDSGNAEGSGSHTHFELLFHGRALDPYPWLLAAWERAAAERSSFLVGLFQVPGQSQMD